MADPPNQASVSTLFAPRTLVPVSVGCTTVNLYPVVDHTMMVHKRAHAFQINKNALSSQALDLRVMLEALGQQLNLSASVEGMIGGWLRCFQDSWVDFHHLQLLSFLNNAGKEVTDTCSAADPAILLPVVNGALNTCCKAIKFVHVQLTLDFNPLVSIIPPGPTVLRSAFYIKLPQTSVGLVNDSRVNYTLLTFHGPADLRTLTPAKVRAQILDLTLQHDPLDLLPPSFNVRTARTDSTALRIDINSKILLLAFATICNTLFMELCPGYSNQPHTALNHIHQVHVDAAGNQVSSTVQAYFQQLISAARPFSSQQEFHMSVCQRFMDNLDPCLMAGSRRSFPNYSVLQLLNTLHQHWALQLMLQAAQQAENNFASTQHIAREASGLSQAFPTNAIATSSTQQANVFLSQAETTLTWYSQGFDGVPQNRGQRGDRPFTC
jgi:hypothetical protein